MKFGLAVLAAATATLAGGAGYAASPPTHGTLYGVLTRGPIRPVCEIDQPCEAPAPGVMLRFQRSGRVVARVVTGPGGKYRIRLRAASYAVRTSARPFGTVPSPPSARVFAGRTRKVDFSIDTGIR